MDRGAWWATDYGIAKSQTPLSNKAEHTACISTEGPLEIPDQLVEFFSTQSHGCLLWNKSSWV